MGQLQHRPRTLRVLLDDPAAAALSLRTHMPPADLQELLLILATAAADALRDRQKLRTATTTPSGLRAGPQSSSEPSRSPQPHCPEVCKGSGSARTGAAHHETQSSSLHGDA
jgi:hypothetical protein